MMTVPSNYEQPTMELGRLILPLTHAAPKAARDLVARLAESWGLADVEYRARLAVSEIATNALAHTEPGPAATITVVMTRQGKQLRVAIHDASRQVPVILHPAETEETGRGLILVGDITDACGHFMTPSGKAVWFDIAVDWPHTSARPNA